LCSASAGDARCQGGINFRAEGVRVQKNMYYWLYVMSDVANDQVSTNIDVTLTTLPVGTFEYPDVITSMPASNLIVNVSPIYERLWGPGTSIAWLHIWCHDVPELEASTHRQMLCGPV